MAGSTDPNQGSIVGTNMRLKLKQIYERCVTGQYGCFGVPQDCFASFDPKSKSPQLCDMMVTWSKENQIQNDFVIIAKLIGHEVGGYVALGLSKDNQMVHIIYLYHIVFLCILNVKFKI